MAATGLATAALAAALLAAGSQTALAQDVLVKPEFFEESYVGAAALAMPSVQSFSGRGGRLLTGLRIGEPDAGLAADIAALRVALPPSDAARLCLDLTTIDNRYTAESAQPINGARGTPALGLTSSYADALATYTARDLLVRARAADACEATAASVLTPAVLGPGALVAAINVGRGRPTAQLWRDGAAVTDKARCQRDEHAGKSHDCAVPIDGLGAGVYELRIVVPSLTGADIEDSYDVALP
jgi:hypothetical protein